MFCTKCGRELDENESVCPVCGTVNATEATATATTAEYGYDTVNEQLKDEMAGTALKWGIISLAFSASGCLPLLGFIFSFIAKSKALAYEQTFGVLEGKARVGRILGKVGFGVGLGMTIYMGLALLVSIAVGFMGAGMM